MKHKKVSNKNENKLNVSTTQSIPLERIARNSKSISKIDIGSCSCYRNGFCIVRDDKCLPNS